MQTVTLQVDDGTYEKFFWLLNHFTKDEVKVLEQSRYTTDDEHLRGIDGFVASVVEARNESTDNGVTIDGLQW